MATSGISASGRRKGNITLCRDLYAAGETIYVLGHSTAGWAPDTPIRITQVSMWQTTGTDGTSGTLEVWKDTTASGSAVFSAAVASGAGEVTGTDTAPSTLAASNFSTAESVIVRVVSVGKAATDVNIMIEFEYAD